MAIAVNVLSKAVGLRYLFALVLFLGVGLFSPGVAAGQDSSGISYEAGRGLRMHSGRFELRLTGRLLFDMSTFDGAFNAADEGEDADEDSLQSAIVSLGARRGNLSLLAQYSIDNPGLAVAFVTYKMRRHGERNRRARSMEVSVGLQKEPFGLDFQGGSTHLSALERPLIQALVPGISTGALIRIAGRDSTYALGFFERGSQRAATARITWTPQRTEGRVLHSGLALSWRNHGGEDLQVSSRGEVRRAITAVGQAASVTVEASKFLGLEMAVVHGPWSIQGEAILQRLDAARLELGGGAASFSGFYVQTSYFLTGESRGFSFERGRFIKTRLRSENGAWELMIRFSSLDLDDGEPGTQVQNLTLGVNWHLAERLRLMANLVRTQVRGRGAFDAVGSFDRGRALTFRLLLLI